MSAASGTRTDSPIEEKLIEAIYGWLVHNDCAVCTVRTQAQIGPYRADILVTDHGDMRRLVIECDGAAFHTTDKAWERDRRRDRWCALNGIFVMRFTGREITHDARGCAALVGQWIMRE